MWPDRVSNAKPLPLLLLVEHATDCAIVICVTFSFTHKEDTKVKRSKYPDHKYELVIL